MEILGRGTYGAPARDIEQVHVPGRNGDLLFDNGGFLNINVTYPECCIRERFPYYGAALRNFLLSSPGYHELRDSYDPQYYRLAEYRGPFEPDVHTPRNNDSAVFDLTFNAKPFRYLREPGEIGLFTGRSIYESDIVIPTSADGSYSIRVVDGSDSGSYGVSIYKRMAGNSDVRISYFVLEAGEENTVYITADPSDLIYVSFSPSSTRKISIYSGNTLIHYFSGPDGTVKIYNLEPFESLPLISLKSFEGDITVNGNTFSYSNYSSDEIQIDSEEQSVYSNTGSKVAYASGVFPVLVPGLNTITITASESGTNTSIKCRPRFCSL
jgi:phage-related protein